MTTRICKIEKFIPKNGNPVLQVHEEAEIGGRIVSLDPRNPNAEELQDADEKFAAAQQAKIAELESQLSAMTAERDSLATEKTTLTSERDSLQSQVSELTTSRDDLQTQLTEATTSLATATGQVETLTSERDSALEQIATLQSRINELTAEPDVAIVSRRQARLALVDMKLFEIVEKSVYEGPLTVRIEYEAETWRRDNPTLIAMATALGMSDEQIDQFFALAGSK